MPGRYDPAKNGRVWDPLVRIFHWTLVAAVVTAWMERSEAAIHETAGKIVLALIIARTAWGLIGPASARFETFIKGPLTTLKYMWSILRGRPAHFVGHNPAGAAMIGLLLLSLATTTVSGILMTTTALWGNGWVEWVHGTAANATMLLVAGHLLGVLVATIQHREFLPQSMVTGRKIVRTGTPAYLGPMKLTRARLALAAVFAVLASGVWAGSTYLLSGSVWRMNKIIANAYDKHGCPVETVTGPSLEVFPSMAFRYEISLKDSPTTPTARVPVGQALNRANPPLELAPAETLCGAGVAAEKAETTGGAAATGTAPAQVTNAPAGENVPAQEAATEAEPPPPAIPSPRPKPEAKSEVTPQPESGAPQALAAQTPPRTPSISAASDAAMADSVAPAPETGTISSLPADRNVSTPPRTPQSTVPSDASPTGSVRLPLFPSLARSTPFNGTGEAPVDSGVAATTPLKPQIAQSAPAANAPSAGTSDSLVDEAAAIAARKSTVDAESPASLLGAVEALLQDPASDTVSADTRTVPPAAQAAPVRPATAGKPAAVKKPPARRAPAVKAPSTRKIAKTGKATQRKAVSQASPPRKVVKKKLKKKRKIIRQQTERRDSGGSAASRSYRSDDDDDDDDDDNSGSGSGNSGSGSSNSGSGGSGSGGGGGDDDD